ncbi:MAG: glycosyltransferase family 1 protein [Acidobacteriaceae bacterium]
MTTELAIDARWLKTGIGRYTQSLLPGLRGHLPGIRISCIAQSRDASMVSEFVDHVTVCDAGIYGIREQLELPRLSRKAAALYMPHYNIPLLWRGGLLVTIHDLNHLLDKGYRNTWRSRLYARPLLRKAVEKADVIVTPSGYTMLRLQQEFRVDPSRIRVIPCCVAPCFTRTEKPAARARIARNQAISRPYILFVGSCAPNKNLHLLLTAVATLCERRADTPLLVVVGSRGKWEPKTQLRLQAMEQRKQVVRVDQPADSLLADLYSAALMTVMPSFEEGFGLPVIESMACGTPVLCSRAASLPEVAGDAALYFSPYSSEELTAAIEKLIDSSSTQARLIRAGVVRAADFSQKDFCRRQASAIRAVLPN